MKKGRLFVISGPSAAGKGTIVSRILHELDDIELSVSMTTRPPREGEVDGENYYFVSENEFAKIVAEDGFLEHACVYDNSYGTPRKAVAERLKRGIDVILEIDVQGAMNVKKSGADGIFIFIMPPSMEELRERITTRGKDADDVIEARLAEAESEIGMAKEYDHKIVNDDLEAAVANVKKIIIDARRGV